MNVSPATPDKPRTLRIKFRKTGALQYISHLDLNRTITRILVRTEIPVWYTKGYNPIPKLDFAAPLPVGTESVCELLDIRVVKDVDPDAIKTLLNQNLPDDLEVSEVYYPESKLTDLSYADYEITVVAPSIDDSTAEMCRELLSGKDMVVFKKSKSGDRDVDIKPLVVSCAVASEDGKLIVKTRLFCGKIKSLNPEYVVNFIVDKLDLFSGKNDTEYFTIMRTAVFDADMKEFR